MGMTEAADATSTACASSHLDESHLDQQLAKLEGHLQDLLREGSTELSARERRRPGSSHPPPSRHSR